MRQPCCASGRGARPLSRLRCYPFRVAALPLQGVRQDLCRRQIHHRAQTAAQEQDGLRAADEQVAVPAHLRGRGHRPQDAVRQDRLSALPVPCLRSRPRAPSTGWDAAAAPVSCHRPSGLPDQLDPPRRPAQRRAASRRHRRQCHRVRLRDAPQLRLGAGLRPDRKSGHSRWRLPSAATISPLCAVLAEG